MSEYDPSLVDASYASGVPRLPGHRRGRDERALSHTLWARLGPCLAPQHSIHSTTCKGSLGVNPTTLGRDTRTPPRHPMREEWRGARCARRQYSPPSGNADTRLVHRSPSVADVVWPAVRLRGEVSPKYYSKLGLHLPESDRGGRQRGAGRLSNGDSAGGAGCLVAPKRREDSCAMEASRCLHQVVSEERRVDAGLPSAANGAQLVPAWRRSGMMSSAKVDRVACSAPGVCRRGLPALSRREDAAGWRGASGTFRPPTRVLQESAPKRAARRRPRRAQTRRQHPELAARLAGVWRASAIRAIRVDGGAGWACV